MHLLSSQLPWLDQAKAKIFLNELFVISYFKNKRAEELILKDYTWLYIYTNSISKGILLTESVYVMCVWIRQLPVRSRGKYNNV